jgi:hypothetical protein
MGSSTSKKRAKRMTRAVFRQPAGRFMAYSLTSDDILIHYTTVCPGRKNGPAVP